ncbi:hypothetical protein ACFXA3_01340 [Streptomyces sp. NPDC059456]|uniref:hypothetical protein n=1 Tax=Streptomyces sp. NPDC059456 TaxID=3346838 RepID=UPI0036B5014A
MEPFREHHARQGATASRKVLASEFDAAAVREPRNVDSAVDRSVSTAVIADRLDSARTRLLDLFAPHRSETPLARTLRTDPP